MENNFEITKLAMKNNCIICNKIIRPWHLWKYSETRRGNLIFIHDECLGGTDEYKEIVKTNDSG